MIVEVINPILLSTPYVVMMSVATASDALPDIGLNSANGITWLGNPILFVTIDITFVAMSSIPELLNTPIARNSPNNVGNIFITISIPSFAPSTKMSYIRFLSIIPYTIIIIMTAGIAMVDI